MPRSAIALTVRGVAEAIARDVDRDERPARPLHGLAAGDRKDLVVDRADQAGLLGDADEAARRNHAALGLLPARQRLEADRAAGLERHDRLEHRNELVARQG